MAEPAPAPAPAPEPAPQAQSAPYDDIPYEQVPYEDLAYEPVPYEEADAPAPAARSAADDESGAADIQAMLQEGFGGGVVFQEIDE